MSDGQLESWLDGMRSDTIRLFLPALGVDLVVMDMMSDGGGGGGSEWVISVVMVVEVMDGWMVRVIRSLRPESASFAASQQPRCGYLCLGWSPYLAVSRRITTGWYGWMVLGRDA